MLLYARQIIVQALFVMVGVSIVVFLLQVIAGDPVALYLPVDATEMEREAMRQSLGYDDPLVVQYGHFVTRLLQGDFGDSLLHGKPALSVVLERLPATGELTFWAFLLPLIISVPMGVYAANRQGTLLDRVIMSLSILGQSIPVYWLGTVLILIFSVRLGWLPTGGRGEWQQLILPVGALSLYSVARITRMVRVGMLNVLKQDYVRTARSKGITERATIYRHALRNALLPTITLIGLDLGTLLGGAVLTETIFSWPGLGRLGMQSILYRDYPVVQTLVFLIAITYVVINTSLDLIYGMLDPRIRRS